MINLTFLFSRESIESYAIRKNLPLPHKEIRELYITVGVGLLISGACAGLIAGLIIGMIRL